MEYGSTLTIKTFPITELAYGDANAVTANGVMTVDPSVSEELKKIHEDIRDIQIRIVRPDEHDQYTNQIMDVIPISAKALGKIGEGVSHTLGGVYVLLTGADESGRQVCNFGACNGIIRDKIAWGRPGTPEEDDLLILFDVIVREGSWTERATVHAMHAACDRFIQTFRAQMKKFNGRIAAESVTFQEEYRPERPDVVIFKQVSGQGAVYETLLFPNEPGGVEGGISVIDDHWMPVVLTPNEYRDGMLHALD